MLARRLRLILSLELLTYLIVSGATLVDKPFITPGQAILLIATIALVLRTLPTAALFVFSQAHADSVTWKNPLSPRQWMRLLAAEWWAITRLYSLAMVFPKHLAGAQNRIESHPPVLLLHGYLCNEGFWHPLAYRLQKEGIGRVYTLSLNPPFGDMETFVNQLHATIAEIHRKNSSQKIRVVAHSMGGLVTRRYIQCYGSEHLERLITLGCPHQGTEWARWGLGRNARQMEPDSDWLKTLNQAPYLIDTFSLYSRHDNVITPPSNALLPENARTENITLGAVGHLEMAFNKEVHDRVLTCLSSPRKHP